MLCCMLQVAGVRKPLSAALDGLPAAAVRLGLLAKKQAADEEGGATDQALIGSYLPGKQMHELFHHPAYTTAKK